MRFTKRLTSLTYEQNIAPTQKEKVLQENIGSYTMISNNNLTILLTLRKKMKNDVLLNSNINHLNENSI